MIDYGRDWLLPGNELGLGSVFDVEPNWFDFSERLFARACPISLLAYYFLAHGLVTVCVIPWGENHSVAQHR